MLNEKKIKKTQKKLQTKLVTRVIRAGITRANL